MMRPADKFESLLRDYVTAPDALHVIADENLGAVELGIRCAASDAGRIIGSRGVLLNAWGIVARAVWRATGKFVRIPSDGVQDNGDKKQRRTGYDATRFVRFISALVETVFGMHPDMVEIEKDGSVNIVLAVEDDTKNNILCHAVATICTAYLKARGVECQIRFRQP